MTSHSSRRMRSSSREMSWEENRQSFVQEAEEGSVICRWNNSFPMRYPARKNPTENICRRIPFEMKFWLSAVGGFQITKTLTEIAGNRWLKSCMMIRYAVYTPIQKGRIRHTGEKTGGGIQNSLRLSARLFERLYILSHSEVLMSDLWGLFQHPRDGTNPFSF